MKGLRGNIRALLLTFIAMFLVLGIFISYTVFVNGTRWFVSPYNPILSKQKQDIIAGSILDRNYVVLAQSDADGNRVYDPDETVRRALSHTIGDPYGIAASGIESFYANYLLGFNGNVFERIYDSLISKKRQGDSVVTTLSSQLAASAYQALGDKTGAVVVMNYKTGEILASVSTPGYDPATLDRSDATTAKGASYLVNRATMGKYTPGSVFKLVTAAAVLEYRPDLANKDYTCTGEVQFPTGTVVDAAHEVHGTLKMKQALAESCNCIFAQIEGDLGQDAILRMAEKMHYNEDFLLSDLILYKSQFVKAKDGTLDAAWAAVGQYLTTVSPMHICMITAAIANDGVLMEPKLMKSVMNSRNFEYVKMSPRSMGRVLSPDTAAKLRDMMELTVKSGTGKQAAIAGYTVGGKTGSAETSDSKNTKTHAWFTGFINDDNHPLCIVVLVEHGRRRRKRGGAYRAESTEKSAGVGALNGKRSRERPSDRGDPANPSRQAGRLPDVGRCRERHLCRQSGVTEEPRPSIFPLAQRPRRESDRHGAENRGYPLHRGGK